MFTPASFPCFNGISGDIPPQRDMNKHGAPAIPNHAFHSSSRQQLPQTLCFRNITTEISKNRKHDSLDDADLVGDLECVKVLREAHVSLLLPIRPAKDGHKRRIRTVRAQMHQHNIYLENTIPEHHVFTDPNILTFFQHIPLKPYQDTASLGD